MTEHDTIVSTQPDSAVLFALVECDSLGRILLRELDEERGRRTSLEARLLSNGRQTAIKVTSNVQPEEIPVRNVTRSSESTVNTESTEKTEHTEPPSHSLLDYLYAIVIFIMGAAAGYIVKTIRK